MRMHCGAHSEYEHSSENEDWLVTLAKEAPEYSLEASQIEALQTEKAV
jgi:hypothetical protein